MCGLAGSAGAVPVDGSALARVVPMLEHRGPDSSGAWSDPSGAAHLVHCRLAIRDVSPAGHQPMRSSSGTHVVAYNGELYATGALERRLAGRRLRGTSDTELLVEACAEWGVDRILPQLNGQFAFALWDVAEQEMTLVRDRVGIKPLYWSLIGGALRFASELPALLALGGGTGELDRAALVAYLERNHLPDDRTPYRDVRRLRPGELLRFHAGTAELRRWWDPTAAASKARGRLVEAVDEREALGALESTLIEAVRDRLVADVPVGALLSGGIDSSLVTALMVEARADRVRTFSIGFAEARFDESAHARAVASHLGTDHTELLVTEAEALAVVPELTRMFGEPFGDASAIPTALVSRLARRDVTVALSGDGGDEVFGGYPRYWRSRGVLGIRAALPAWSRPVAAGLVDGAATVVGAIAAGGPRRAGSTARWLRKTARMLDAVDVPAAHGALISQWPDAHRLVRGAPRARPQPPADVGVGAALGAVDLLQLADLRTTLPDDILTKVDRASMRVGLEVRVPLLDHRVIAAAWSLPAQLRFDGRQGKIALRRVLAQRVPPALWERPKHGFSVPIGDWLRGPLRPWAEELLRESALEAHGILVVAEVQRAWRRHLAGMELGDPLWGALMLTDWLEQTSRAPGH